MRLTMVNDHFYRLATNTRVASAMRCKSLEPNRPVPALHLRAGDVWGGSTWPHAGALSPGNTAPWKNDGPVDGMRRVYYTL
ncbi:MAG: hypothetical protein DMG43_14850 [Acidobacteria bacterium]|nr:MAG: hypothetical protein DMG43_14850 [Acidobacteriota bacterium]